MAACSGSTDPGGDFVPDPPTTLEPIVDTEVSGTLEVERVVIPAGVTVTATGPLTLDVAGDIALAGTLAGECVDIVIAGRGDASITGTIRNVCSAAAPEPGRLVLSAEGAVILDGAVIENSGDVILADRPDRRMEELFDHGTSASAAPIVPTQPLHAGVFPARSAAFWSLPASTAQGDDGSPFTMSNTTLTNRAVNTDGLFGNSVAVIRSGPVSFDGGNRLEAAAGEAARSTTVTGPMNVTAHGEFGGWGGYVGVKAPRITVREIHGPNVFMAGDGGAGGAAFAVAQPAAGPKAPSATATGGGGGPAGCVVFNTYVDPDAPQVEDGGTHLSGGRIVAGKAGRGGEANARGADGQPAQEGGDATATSGEAGDADNLLVDCVAHPVVYGALEIDPLNPPTVIPAAHGDGGVADAHGGRGGDGVPSHPDGARGGNVTALGGATSVFRAFNGLDRDFPRDELFPAAGVPGDAIARGGRGGDGIVGACPAVPGGIGGPGGTIRAEAGATPDRESEPGGGAPPAAEITLGDVTLDIVGNGGDGKDGDPGGAGGLPGDDDSQIQQRTVVEPSFEPGQNGADLTCGVPFDPTGTYIGLLRVFGGNPAHNPHVHNTEDGGTEVEIDVSRGSILLSGPSPMPSLEGAELLSPGSFTASGSGTVAGIADVQVEVSGTITEEGAMAADITYGGQGRLPGGQPIVYRFEGTR